MLLLGAGWAGEYPESGSDPVLPGSEIAASISGPDALSSPSETPGRHASLAFFSLGSLAVGGVFYGISTSLERPNVSYTAGDRSRISTAVGVAGLTALIAAGSYLFFVDRDAEKASAWDARVSGGTAPGGGIQVAASLSLPLP